MADYVRALVTTLVPLATFLNCRYCHLICGCLFSYSLIYLLACLLTYKLNCLLAFTLLFRHWHHACVSLATFAANIPVVFVTFRSHRFQNDSVAKLIASLAISTFSFYHLIVIT